MLASFYQSPRALASAGPTNAWPETSAVKAVICAGFIWGLFNAALGMVFGFGSGLLIERGWSQAAAGSTTSLVLWGATLSVPLGGILADRFGRPIFIMLGGFGLFALALLVATRTESAVAAFIALGLVGGAFSWANYEPSSKGFISICPSHRNGILFDTFYVCVVAAPIVAGMLAKKMGSAQVAFDLGAVMLVLCFPLYAAYRFFADRSLHETALGKAP